MRRKKERSKQGQTNKQGKVTQHTHAHVFPCMYIYMYMYMHACNPLTLWCFRMTMSSCFFAATISRGQSTSTYSCTDTRERELKKKNLALQYSMVWQLSVFPFPPHSEPVTSHSLYVYNVHVLMRDEKEGRKKQASSNKQTNKAKQHSTPKAVTFPKKNELPQVGFEPTTLYTLDRALNHMYVYYCFAYSDNAFNLALFHCLPLLPLAQ